ncbi:MAG: hypothetical protein ACD_60C00057G0014 [uncultured bacterium]|nr:MAG: hypothetical protein ACD_60C00057G0014 [uncultured bacterium]
MDGSLLHTALLGIQRTISFLGILVILSGILIALFQYVYYILIKQMKHPHTSINTIRLSLGRILILGLEFIIAADLIGTTTTPDYYSVGIVACIVAIRSILSYTLNRELVSLAKEK